MKKFIAIFFLILAGLATLPASGQLWQFTSELVQDVECADKDSKETKKEEKEFTIKPGRICGALKSVNPLLNFYFEFIPPHPVQGKETPPPNCSF